MPSYSPSTISRLGDIRRGLLVETGVVSYLNWGVTVQAYLFRVYNRIQVIHLWGEVVDTLTGAGALVLFNFASTTPSVAVQPISAASTTIHGFVRGRRFSLVGTSVATAVSVDGTAGISYTPTGQMIVGIAPTAAGVTSVGNIGVLTSVAVLTAGTAKFSCCYAPIDEGAYVEALL